MGSTGVDNHREKEKMSGKNCKCLVCIMKTERVINTTTTNKYQTNCKGHEMKVCCVQ